MATTAPPTNGLSYRLSFAPGAVKTLSVADFDTNNKELITIKADSCTLVLFYVENSESLQLANIWATAAQQVAGPTFAAVNMLAERAIAEAFTRLRADGSHPLHWAALRQYPYILVYRNRWPVAVYNGPREVQTIIDYALTLACDAGYYEPLQLGGSMQADTRLEMGPYQPYTNVAGQPPAVHRTSLEFSAGSPIRGFNTAPTTTTPTTTAPAAPAATATAPPTGVVSGLNVAPQ